MLREILVQARLSAGLKQDTVAERLDKPQSYVSKVEKGERRLDVIEFVRVCQAIGSSPSVVLDEVIDRAKL